MGLTQNLTSGLYNTSSMAGGYLIGGASAVAGGASAMAQHADVVARNVSAKAIESTGMIGAMGQS